MAYVCCNISILSKRAFLFVFLFLLGEIGQGVFFLFNTALDVTGVATHVWSICACVGPCLFSPPCDLFADRPTCSPFCQGFHANAASGKTKDEDSFGEWDHSFSLLHLLTPMVWNWYVQRYERRLYPHSPVRPVLPLNTRHHDQVVLLTDYLINVI